MVLIQFERSTKKMAKSRIPSVERRSAGGELLRTLEGQLEEICRDLTVQVKRMSQLELQAGELRVAFRRLLGRRAGH